MKTILTILLIAIIGCKTSKPVKTNIRFITTDYSGVFNWDSTMFLSKSTDHLYIGTYKPDTIPVIIYAVDTTLRGIGTTFSLNGYAVGNFQEKYLNHLKQPLPERLIVWMVVRRKDK